MSDESLQVHVIVPEGDDAEGPPGEALFGSRKTKTLSGDPDQVRSQLPAYVKIAGDLLSEARALGDHYAVDSITFHLGGDAQLKVGFLGGAGINASIEVVVKRQG